MEYASHEFVYCSVHPLFRKVFVSVKSKLAEADPAHIVPGETSPHMVINTKPRIWAADYIFRNRLLELMPFYFFLSSCEAATNLDSRSLEWEAVTRDDVTKRQRSYEQQPVRSRDAPEFPLLDAPWATHT